MHVAPWLDWLWCLCVTIFRARYSLLTLALPPVLAGLALWRWPRGALYSLLLPRGYRDGAVVLPRTLADLFWIAFTACSIATLAGAGVNVATIHGPERAPSYDAPPAPCQATGTAAAAPDDAAAVVVWPLPLLAAAVAATLILPCTCIAIWRREQPDDQKRPRDVPLAVAAVALGAIAAALVVLGVGVLRRSLFGADDWILPLRPPLALDWRAGGARLLAAAGAALDAVGVRAGYLAERRPRSLLAGQAELMLSVCVASLVYAGSLVQTALTRRPNAWVCTAVYLLVCIGTAGVVLAGVAFWADRYGLSTLLMVLLFAWVVGWLADTDHFFELLPHGTAAAGRSSPDAPDAAAARPLPSLRQCFDNRLARIPRDGGGERTAIVVTASGGGIQASAWTAEVLTKLAAKFPHFAESLCLMSGVSGGSVGLGYVLAGTWLHPPQESGVDPEARRHSIRNRARASLLEYVAWGAAFADLPRLFTGIIPRNRLVDRGWAIEWLLDKRMMFAAGGGAGDSRPRSWSLRDLCPGVGSGAIPVPLFNATCVQTGQRVIAAPVSFARRACGDSGNGPRPLHLPEDYSRPGFPADPRIATAIRLSAAFSYVSPVARPTREDESRWRSAHDSATAAAAAARFDLHLCDGAYADNTGVVSAVEAGAHLLEAIAAANATCPPDKVSPADKAGGSGACRVLWIRIEPFPPAEDRPSRSRDGFSQVLFGPAFGLISARGATQQERADREIERFAAEAARLGIDFRAVTIRFRGDSTAGSAAATPETPPLSWLLSQRQQQAIEANWNAIATTEEFATAAAPWNLHDGLGTQADDRACDLAAVAADGRPGRRDP